MKRTLSILLVLLLAMFVMSSCTLLDDILAWADPGCQHDYEAVVTDPTCTAAGYTTYTCKLCQDSYTADETAMKEHDFKDGVCSCGAADPDYVPPHEHNFVDGKCECGETDPNYVPPHEHNFVDGKCECGEYDHEHEYEENVHYHPELVAATCTTPGVAVFECTLCDYYYTEETPVDPEAHGFWGEREVLAEADCQTQTNGLVKVYCDNEGCTAFEEVEIYYSEVHNWDVQKEIYATCTSDGEYYAVCTLCGEIESYISYSEGHYNWYLACGDTGTCMECGIEFTLEHDTTLDPATCTNAAFCMNCLSYVGEPLGHSFDGAYCSVCGEMDTEHYEEVEYSINISDLTVGVLSEDEINGMFTIVAGSEIRNRTKTFEGVEYTKSVKIGNKDTKIKISVPGAGKLFFIVQNGSSGADMQFITVTAPDGTVYDIEFVGNASGSPLVMIEVDVTEGEWIISRGKNGGTQDVFALWLNCVVEKSEESGFELVAEGKVDYLIGDVLNFIGLRLNAVFANGKTEPIDASALTVDHGAVDMSVSGTYPVLVYYKDYEPITYYVNVYAPESIELDFDAIEKIANNSYGNGVYYNHSFRELYFVGDEFDRTGLTVTVVAKCGDKTLKFRVDDYTVSGFDSASADCISVTFATNGLSETIELWVTAALPTPDENGVYQLLVDPAYEGMRGAMSGPYHVFRTIQESLEFAATIDANAAKVINVAPGYYNEKLEITVPNLEIIGWGATPDEVVIEWNSIYGQLDAGGFSHVTDSTATVAIRESAYNVTIENVTISNYWNSQDRMDEAGLEIERALALLVQADRFIMKDSKLLGIQDTLELFTGRQYFENVYISGYTDFIFGTNNTTLFKNCTIHVIDTAKDDKGTAGYITAFKGSNKGANDSIVYGAIFYGCKFTADAGVTPGCTAIGRTWGAYAAVAVINSELGGHISVDGYNSADNKNKRYIAMNGINPTDATVQFVEFGNTGAGALTEAVAGMRFLTDEEAALYIDMSVIFGTVNGNVSYLDAWQPGTAPIVDDRTYYYFNGTEGTSGTSYTYSDNIQGTVVEWQGLTIDATTGKLTFRGSDSQFNQGAKIIFQVEAGTLVTVVSYPGYGYYTINGVAHNANDTFSVYFAEATEVVIEATSTSYLYQLIINPDEEAPAAPTLNEIKVSGLNTNYNVGDEFSLDGVVVKAYYSDFSVVTLTDYTVDASAVNPAANGSYDVVFTYGDKSVTLTVNFVGADTPIDLTVTFGSNGNYKDSGITFPLESMRDNGGDNSQMSAGSFSFEVKAGATVTINGYPGYTSYTLGDGTFLSEEITDSTYLYIASEDVTLTITAVSSNNYLYSFSVVYPKEAVKEDFEVTFGSEGNYKDSGIDFSGITIGDNGGSNSQVKEGSFSFTLYAGGTLTINGYPGYTSYTLGDGTTTTDEITADVYTYTAEADVTITITPVSGNNYFYSFSVTYSETPAEPDEPTPDEPTPDEPAEPETYVYTINFSELEEFSKGTYADGDIQVYDDVFTFIHGKDSRIDPSSKTFEDGFSGTLRFGFGGKYQVKNGAPQRALQINATGACTVTVWWVAGGDERSVDLLDSGLNVIDTTGIEITNGTLYITTFEITEAGVYYLANCVNNNYWFQVEVASAAA